VIHTNDMGINKQYLKAKPESKVVLLFYAIKLKEL